MKFVISPPQEARISLAQASDDEVDVLINDEIICCFGKDGKLHLLPMSEDHGGLQLDKGKYVEVERN